MESEMQNIIDRILCDTREDAESILMEARKSSKKMIEEQIELARKRSEEKVSSVMKRGEEEAKLIKRTVTTDAKRKASWMVLSERERLVTSVLEEVRTRLSALSRSGQYISVLQKLIVDAGIALGGGELEVLLSEQDEKILLKLNLLAKEIAEKTGKETELQISSERIENCGGCVIRTYDKRIILDNTFPSILKRREKDLRFKIAKILFND